MTSNNKSTKIGFYKVPGNNDEYCKAKSMENAMSTYQIVFATSAEKSYQAAINRAVLEGQSNSSRSVMFGDNPNPAK